MKLRFLVALFMALSCTLSRAQMMTPIVFDTTSATVTLPGDIIAFTHWCGMRAYSAATAGTKAIQLRRTSDTVLTDINTISTPGATFGNLDLTAATTACGAGCTVAKCYDKVGTLDLVQATAGNQPTFVFNCLNTSLPCMEVGASSSAGLFSSSYTPGSTSPVGLSLVFNRNSGTGTACYLCQVTQTRNKLIGSTANVVRLTSNANNIGGTASDGSFHATNGVINGASSVLNIDATETTGTVTGSSNTGQAAVNGAVSTTYRWAEAGISEDATPWSAGTRSALQQSQHLYWGTP